MISVILNSSLFIIESYKILPKGLLVGERIVIPFFSNINRSNIPFIPFCVNLCFLSNCSVIFLIVILKESFVITKFGVYWDGGFCDNGVAGISGAVTTGLDSGIVDGCFKSGALTGPVFKKCLAGGAGGLVLAVDVALDRGWDTVGGVDRGWGVVTGWGEDTGWDAGGLPFNPASGPCGCCIFGGGAGGVKFIESFEETLGETDREVFWEEGVETIGETFLEELLDVDLELLEEPFEELLVEDIEEILGEDIKEILGEDIEELLGEDIELLREVIEDLTDESSGALPKYSTHALLILGYVSRLLKNTIFCNDSCINLSLTIVLISILYNASSSS